MASVRKFIRHPSDIPIHVSDLCYEDSVEASQTNYPKINNVSLGGLAFFSPKAFAKNQLIAVSIPCLVSQPILKGEVLWCHQIQSIYEIGAKFDDPNVAFQLRMIEQICHIEHYRKEVERLEGRLLTSEQAAREWVQLFAGDFPQFDKKEHH